MRASARPSSAKLERERDEYKKLNALLQEQVERLKRGLLGQKAERLPKNDAQLSLTILNLALGNSACGATRAAPSSTSFSSGAMQSCRACSTILRSHRKRWQVLTPC
jgi:hypothetical protein